MSHLAAPAAPAMPDASVGWLRRSALWAWQRPWLALPVLALPALWPFFEIGLTHSSDGALHLLRLVALDHQVRQSVLYPRWSPELFAGLGYPVFNFYGPFAYYLAELLHLLGFDFVSALLAAFVVLVVASGLGMYLLARDVLGSQQRWAALVAATAYMYAPYLLSNVHIRGAVAEVGAQAWLPWVFWSTRRLLTAQHPAQYVLAVALTLGGLAVTHNITLLFIPLALAGYILVIWWQAGHARAYLGWITLAIAAAMGVSAFFWLPLIGERQMLAQSAYETSAVFLPENVWTWRNFLDTTFTFEHTFDPPYQLGLVQALLALTGVVVARRRDPEWLYFIALAVLTGIGISAWLQPLWLSSNTLLIAQFPWRLLAFMSIPLALFTGAILVRIRRDVVSFVGACALLGLIIAANRPAVGWMPVLARPGDSVTVPAIAQYEHDTGALGTGSAQEFRPRWSMGSVYEPSGADFVEDDRQIIISQADDFRLRASVSTPNGGPLRFTNLYYPGWQATLADGRALATYPSTNLGLLTVDLPPGDHELFVRWVGTGLQRLAAWLSLATLALLSLLVWRVNRPRWLVAVPLSLLALGLSASLTQPATHKTLLPTQPVTSSSLEMLGYRLGAAAPHEITIYPTWYARKTPDANTLVSWQLRDKAGGIAYETTRQPYFDSQTANNWPPGTLVDDAYRLTLPPGLAVGSYGLAVKVAEGDSVTPWTLLGGVTVEAPVPAQSQPAHALEVSFGGLAKLVGFDLTHGRRTADLSAARPTVVRPGDQLAYTLYWQALQRLPVNYHGFIHLVDGQGTPLVKRDQVAGSSFRVPMSWDTATAQPDHYALRIPDDAPSGLYWPMVGLYEFETVQLLPVEDAAGQPLGDTFRLPPIKVLGANPVARPQQQVSARLGDLATLLGYDLALPETGLRPGSPFSVTLYYRVDGATDRNLTQFVQLYSPESGMAAQQDAQPRQGANPAWAWVPGEVVIDTLTLEVRPDATPGVYELLVGLYDPSDGARLAVTDDQGAVTPEGHIKLTSLPVQP
jgi:hypothetical protein